MTSSSSSSSSPQIGSFNIDEWKQRFTQCTNIETRCQMLRADKLIIANLINTDESFRQFILDNRQKEDEYYMTRFCYKENMLDMKSISKGFRKSLRKSKYVITQLCCDQKQDEKDQQKELVNECVYKLITLYVQRCYSSSISTVLNHKAESAISQLIDKQIEATKFHMGMLAGNKKDTCIQLEKACVDLNAKVCGLVTKILDEVIIGEGSCRLIIDLVLSLFTD